MHHMMLARSYYWNHRSEIPCREKVSAATHTQLTTDICRHIVRWLLCRHVLCYAVLIQHIAAITSFCTNTRVDRQERLQGFSQPYRWESL